MEEQSTKLVITEDIWFDIREENEVYEEIEDEILSVDSEKGITYREKIIKQKNTGRYFKFRYSRTNHHSFKELNGQPIANEVFKTTKRITVYE